MLSKSPTYKPKLPRWQHQDKALDAIDGANAFALFMEMRTGKTKTILDEFGQDELDRVVSQLLVIAPAGVYRTWETDAMKHLSDDLLECTMIAQWKSGPSAQQKRDMLEFLNYDGPRILLVNVEALSRVKAAKQLCQQYMEQAATTLVIDESTTIKNREASRTQFCIKLASLATKRRILSGLPSPQSPLDLWSQFTFLDPKILGFRKYSDFEERYCVMERKPFGPNGSFINIPAGYKNLDELKALIDPHSFRVRLADCYDLPERMFIRREVELTDDQQTAYEEMVENAVVTLENQEHVTATIVLTQMLRLHQILCGVTKSDNGVEVDFNENRIDEMMNILENTSGKAIIWAAYDANVRRIVDRITKVYGPGSVARFWGGNADTREAEEKAFKTDPKCRFMVATAAAGGRGRTWDVADTVIYYSNTFSLEHRVQSEERAQVVGKRGSVGYYDLIAAGTIEEKIVEALREKKNLSNIITGDQWKAWIT